MLKTFTIYPEKDSVRAAFHHGQRGTTFRLTLERRLTAFPEYLLKQDGLPVAILRGKEMVVGGEHFAVIPLLPLNWAETGLYAHHPDNVPYWDGEQRLKSLDLLLYSLSQGWTIPAALDDAVDAEDDEFFAGIPEVAYTGQQPEDFPLRRSLEWEPEPETPEPAGRAAQPRDEYLASSKADQPILLARSKIYPWTFWYRGGDGAAHQVILEATYKDAQRVWDKLSTTLDMTSKRP